MADLIRDNFESKRFVRTLRLDLFTNGRRFLLFGAAAVALYALSCLLSLLRLQGMGDWPSFLSSFGLLLGLGGTAQLFRSEHSPERAPFSLMIPASMPEKFLSKFLLSLIGYPLFLMVSLFAIGNLFEGMAALFGAGEFDAVLPDKGFLSTLVLYAIGHAILFAGAVFFKSNAVGKTLLWGGLYLALCSILFAIVGTVWAAQIGLLEIILSITKQGAMQQELVSQGESVGGGVLLWLARLALFLSLYTAAWFRFREIEVR